VGQQNGFQLAQIFPAHGRAEVPFGGQETGGHPTLDHGGVPPSADLARPQTHAAFAGFRSHSWSPGSSATKAARKTADGETFF